VLRRAGELKALHRRGERYAPFLQKVLGMIFEKASTRTRISFEAGMAQLGGSAIFLSPRDTQLGRGEPIEDTARVLSSMVDLVMIRTFEHAKVERFAACSKRAGHQRADRLQPSLPIAGRHSDLHRASRRHSRADRGLDRRRQQYVQQLSRSAACQFDFQLRIAVPPGYEPDADLLKRAAGRVVLLRDPLARGQRTRI
jgi:ornithine carbamoyltransferase